MLLPIPLLFAASCVRPHACHDHPKFCVPPLKYLVRSRLEAVAKRFGLGHKVQAFGEAPLQWMRV
jgi:hypothetical protein